MKTGQKNCLELDEIRSIRQLRHHYDVEGIGYFVKNFNYSEYRIKKIYHSHLTKCRKRLKKLLNCGERELGNLIFKMEKDELKREMRIDKIEFIDSDELLLLKEKFNNFAGVGVEQIIVDFDESDCESIIKNTIRIALICEYYNSYAKMDCSKYDKNKLYGVKRSSIKLLCHIFKQNEWEYGYGKDNGICKKKVMYFEIPGCEQICWHFDPPERLKVPKYKKKWDGKKDSNLNKLEKTTRMLLK